MKNKVSRAKSFMLQKEKDVAFTDSNAGHSIQNTVNLNQHGNGKKLKQKKRTIKLKKVGE